MPIKGGSGIPWTLPKHQRYVFSHALLVDPLEGQIRQDVTVITSRGIIERIDYGRDEEISIDAFNTEEVQTIEIDLEGRYLCPGLIDCHVHLNAVPGESSLGQMSKLPQEIISLRTPHLCRQMLLRGFTSARDCGGSSVALKNAIREGVVMGPRLFIAGHQLTQTGGHGDSRDLYDTTQCCGGHVFGSGRLCDGVTECMRVARDQLRKGCDFIKIFGGGGISSETDALDSVQFSPVEIRAIVDVAKRNHTYVTCHAYTPDSIRNAIENGVSGIEHGNLIDPPTAKMMAEKNIFLTPTLVTYSVMATDEYSTFLPPEAISKNKEVLKSGLNSLKIADEAGITMCFGTDLLGSMTQFESHEFAIRSQVLSPVKILQSATTNAAKMLRQDNNLGQIKQGFLADLLILNKNPFENINILDNPENHLLAVLKEGRVVVSRWSKLDEEIKTSPVQIE